MSEGAVSSQLLDGLAEDFLCGSVDQEAIIEHDAQRIVANHEPDGIVLIQNRKDKRTLDLFQP